MLDRLAPLASFAFILLLSGCASPPAQHDAANSPVAVDWQTAPISAPFESPDRIEDIAVATELARQMALMVDNEPYALPDLADSLLERGFELVGTRYRYGGGDVKGGFDCSGFVGFLFREEAGITLPRSTREMINVDAPVVARNELVPGDVIFFNNRGRGRVSHAGIYIGEGKFIHSASRHSGGVRVDSLSESYWTRSYMEAKRVLAMTPTQLARN